MNAPAPAKQLDLALAVGVALVIGRGSVETASNFAAGFYGTHNEAVQEKFIEVVEEAKRILGRPHLPEETGELAGGGGASVLSRRDYFALAALQGVLAQAAGSKTMESVAPSDVPGRVAKAARMMADALLKELDNE